MIFSVINQHCVCMCVYTVYAHSPKGLLATPVQFLIII